MRQMMVAMAVAATVASAQAPRVYRNVGLGTVSPSVFAITVTTFPSSTDVHGQLELMALFRGSPVGWIVSAAVPRSRHKPGIS